MALFLTMLLGGFVTFALLNYRQPGWLVSLVITIGVMLAIYKADQEDARASRAVRGWPGVENGVPRPVGHEFNGEPPRSLTRLYHGKQAEASASMARDAGKLERLGYVPISQNYVRGEWGCGAWVLAFLAMIFLIGLLILAYMVLNPPAGTLTVVYERRSSIAPPQFEVTRTVDRPVQSPIAPPSVGDRLRELQKLKDDGLVSEEEYADTRRSILGRL